MKLKFTKMSGAGNDFVVVDNRNGLISNPAFFAQKVCERKFSIGADGVLLLESSSAKDSSFEMKYYNADGSSAGMCGNGGRCIAKFAYDTGIVTANDFVFSAFGYNYHARGCAPNLYELQMKNPLDFIYNQSILLNNGNTAIANYVNTGTDHCVIFLEENNAIGEIDSCDVFNIGKEIRYHKTYQPNGANVNFVSQIDANNIEIRTYERGVENETLACGTGSVASAILSSLKFGVKSPIGVKVRSGENLYITFDVDSEKNFNNVKLRGSAITTFVGEIEI